MPSLWLRSYSTCLSLPRRAYYCAGEPGATAASSASAFGSLAHMCMERRRSPLCASLSALEPRRRDSANHGWPSSSAAVGRFRGSGDRVCPIRSLASLLSVDHCGSGF